MRSTQRRTEFGQRVLEARTHAKMTQHTLASAVGMSQGTLGETEKQALSSTFTAQIAWATGVNAYWLATGKGEMLGRRGAGIDADQPKATDDKVTGREAVGEAVNILGICLQGMDEESRRVASHFLREMAESPGGGWSGRLTELIETYATVELLEEIGIYVRSGKYPISLQKHAPKIKPKSGGKPSAAVAASHLPTGQNDADTSGDRGEDKQGSSDRAAGSS